MEKNSLRWDSLLRLAGLLSKGKEDVLGELSEDDETESPNCFDVLDREFLDVLNRGFLKKRKRSPRNHTKKCVISKKPMADHQTNPRSTPCTNPKFKRSVFHTNPEDSNKKMKRCLEYGETSSTPMNRKSKQRLYVDRHIIIDNNPCMQQQHPSLPEAIRRRIFETGGRFAVCVIEKALFPTDVDFAQCRLSVPLRQVRERFLFRDEAERLLAHTDGGIQTTLIQPCLEECEITFGLWGSNTTYVLKNGWKPVCIRNNLSVGMVVRLWAFRRKSGLCFALEARSFEMEVF